MFAIAFAAAAAITIGVRGNLLEHDGYSDSLIIADFSAVQGATGYNVLHFGTPIDSVETEI